MLIFLPIQHGRVCAPEHLLTSLRAGEQATSQTTKCVKALSLSLILIPSVKWEAYDDEWNCARWWITGTPLITGARPRSVRSTLHVVGREANDYFEGFLGSTEKGCMTDNWIIIGISRCCHGFATLLPVRWEGSSMSTWGQLRANPERDSDSFSRFMMFCFLLGLVWIWLLLDGWIRKRLNLSLWICLIIKKGTQFGRSSIPKRHGWL